MFYKLKSLINTRLGFLFLLVFLVWIKTVIVYYADFSLGLTDPFQHFIAIINPIGFTIILFSLSLFINKAKPSYIVMLIFYLALNLLLYANILYFREFTNFIPFTTMTGVSAVSKGLGTSTLAVMEPKDLLYLLDFLLLAILYLTKNLRLDPRPFRKLNAVATTLAGAAFFSLNMMLAETNRPQLLGRTFDQTYVVKYLGIPTFTVYDAIQTAHSDQVKSTANGTDIDPDLAYIHEHYAKPNPKYFGVAKKKNIIIIHLESFHQFLLNMKVNDQEVTPFLNSLYNSNETLSYDNFYNQVGSGKTIDAETMLETGLFGLPTGNYFNHQGTTNTAQAAPAILNQDQGYTSAVFHGNVGSFYSRDTVYKNLGYDYFFDQQYFDAAEKNTMTFGLKDKLMLSESTKYLEQLQQPFYAKFITVTNHYSFELPDYDSDGFVTSDTPNQTVNQYFETAHYLDSALEEFFNYLKQSGLYNNSMIVLYGDHYGLTPDQTPYAGSLLGYDQDNWNDFNNAQMQKVPFMIHMKGLKGGISHKYGGEIDVLPTLLHLAGINTQNYMQVGTDLLSKQHSQIVPFRNGNFITPKYTVIKNKNKVYLNKTGEEIDLALNPELKKQISKWNQQVKAKFKVSDKINRLNLLRFYTPAGFKPVDPSQYSYQNQIERLEKIRNDLGNSSTSLYSKNDDKSTTPLYKTDAPELKGNRDPIDNLYSAEDNKN